MTDTSPGSIDSPHHHYYIWTKIDGRSVMVCDCGEPYAPQDQTQEALDAADNAVIEAKMKQVYKENRPLSDQTQAVELDQKEVV